MNEIHKGAHLKIVLLGSENSGKTCLVIRYLKWFFTKEVTGVSIHTFPLHFKTFLS